MRAKIAVAVLLALLAPAAALAQRDNAPNSAPGAHGSHVMPAQPPPSSSSGTGFAPLTVADVQPIARLPVGGLLEPAPIPPSMAPDVVGAFRLVCNVSHISHDDPIAFPGQPGKAHLHMFFGNTRTDAHSTYASLRESGEGTCQGGALNRSAYWIPALIDGGRVVVPDFVGLYYKRRPAGDPECSRAGKRCAGIPVGLRAIFGTNYLQGDLESPHVRFDCNTEASTSSSLATAVRRCRGQSHIYARLAAPDCWDGLNLDSADHQAHLAYPEWRNGGERCPATHPVVIPRLELIVAYAMLPGDTPEKWIFSSDLVAGAEAGTTFHADYMEAWEPDARETWEANCIDKMVSCTGGDLGNGRRMKTPRGFMFAQRPHWMVVRRD